MNSVEKRYIDGSYLAENPTWDREDAPWKAAIVKHILSDNQIKPSSICEVGCGSGDILIHLAKYLPDTKMTGFDISPQAAEFWENDKHINSEGVNFCLGDFHAINKQKFDVLLMIDVFEHVRDPFSFLENSRRHATHFVFHIPLDLNTINVLRGYPLINARKKTGHLHYYTKDLALATLIETGYKILDWRYTGVSLNMPKRFLKTRLMSLPRRMAYAVNKDFGVRLFGGETLLVLAKPLS